MAAVRCMLLVAAMLLALAGGATAQDETPAQACDRLAGEPGAVDGAPGVPMEAIDADAASAACAAALEQQPGDARLSHQYARALERSGRLEDARRLYEWAASDGFAPAEAALQRLDAMAAAAAPGPSPQDLQGAAEAYAGLASALRRYAAALPQDPSDPLTLLSELGNDPAALLRWVQDATRLVAYRGSLRGPRGVLMDRSGNSLDRALLLAALLREAGQEIRLAHATLSEDKAKALLPATERVVAVPTVPELSREDLIAVFAADPRLDRALVERAVDRMLDKRTRADALVAERLGRVLPVIRDAAPEAVAQADTASKAAALAALADHYWVELRTGTGWQALDPDGDALGAVQAAETLDPAKLPDELRHAVSLRVILELQDDAGRREEKLLEWSGYPADLLDQPITLLHFPRSLSSLDQVMNATDYQQRMIQALDAESAWVPVLQVGGTEVVDKLFTRDGATPQANLNPLAGTGAAIFGITEALDSVLGGDGTAPAPKKAIPTAEWLETEIRVPGADPIVERRTIFDLLGPAARAAGTKVEIGADALRDRAIRLVGDTQILITGATPSPLYVARIAVRDLAAIADTARSVTEAAAAGGINFDDLPIAPKLPLALYTFASDRLSHPEGKGQALASPNIVLLHHQFRIGAGASIAESVELDIVRNEVAAPRQPGLDRLVQGVADTVVEGAVLAAPTVEHNAAALLAEDLAAGRRWSRLDAADRSRLDGAGVPADFRARVAADLEAGLIVVTPEDLAAAAAADRLAWWRIDPRTGTTLGMLPDGGGAEMAEHSSLLHTMHFASCAFSAMGVMLGHANASIGLALCVAGSVIPGGIGKGIGIAGIAFDLLEIVGSEGGHGEGGHGGGAESGGGHSGGGDE